MLKALNLTFEEIQDAGYISVDTVCAIKPKEKIGEIDLVFCQFQPYDVCLELESLFGDDIAHILNMFEKLKNDLETKKFFIINLLSKVLEDFTLNEEILISNIGKMNFLLKYIYCKEDALLKRPFVEEQNYNTILDIRNRFKLLYESHNSSDNPVYNQDAHSTYYTEFDINDQGEKLEEPFGGIDFLEEQMPAISPHVKIHKDCCKNPEDKKYVLFLARMEDADFQIFDKTLFKLLKRTSVRAKNGITGIGAREYYVNYLFADPIKLFQIRNFGRKSIAELDRVKQEILDFVTGQYSLSDTELIEQELADINIKSIENKLPLREKLSEYQYSILQSKFKDLLNQASVRVKNSIAYYNPDFLEDFVNNEGNIRALRNVGKKSELEIREIIRKARSIISSLPSRDLTPEEIALEEKKQFYGRFFDGFSHRSLVEKGYIPMFHLMGNYLKSELNNKALYFFNAYTPLFQDTERCSLESIAEAANRSRERIRQICIKCNKQLREIDPQDLNLPELNYSKIINQKDDWQYIIDKLGYKNEISLEDLEQIVSEENCNLSMPYLQLLFTVIFNNNYCIVGNDPMPAPNRKPQEWTGTYIITKDLVDAFDFDKMRSIVIEYQENNSTSIAIAKDEMLLDFFILAWKEFDTNKVEDITEIVSNMLIQEFAMIPDFDFNFTIEGQKIENTEDIIYEELVKNENPMSFDELFAIVNAKYPNRYKSSSSLKSIVYKNPRFCTVGVNGLVGLMEWDHVKIGSIRDIIVQYLDKFDEPKHISDIVKYVLKYRDTNENSIRSTMGSGDQFILLSGAQYGLKDKIYPDRFFEDQSLIWFKTRIKDLEEFILDNRHFPFLPSDDAEEESLYRWWAKVRRENNNDEERVFAINRINELYGDYPSTRSEYSWFQNCEDYKRFVKNNHRRPKNSIYEERNLSKWFSKAYKDFSDGDLTSGQETAFIKLCKIL